MPASLKTFTLPYALLCILALAIAATTFASQSTAAPAEYAEYQNERWHFSLAVPADMTFVEYEQPGDGQAIQFSDATADKLFLVSAWPYTQLDLTLGREGLPSGTSDQPDHLEIVDVVRDDLFTVLFQKNGVRYSVKATPELEPWLIEILKTWEFLD